MSQQQVAKFTIIVNTLILGIVFGLMAFFNMLNVPFLVYFSIPTACIYIFGYVLIYLHRLDIYVWMVYIWLTLYMCVTTVCLGYDFGFHLYCMSMIPVMFVTEYLAYKLEQRSLKAFYVCIAVVLVYLTCTGYVSYHGPVFETDKSAAGIFWCINSMIVFGFLVFYTNWLIKLVISSENRLKEMAQIDELTGLFNRHYMMDILDKKNDADYCLIIADIDHFKKINDTYGHNAGDYVLQTLAGIFRERLQKSYVCRWGGEEFLFLTEGRVEDCRELIESLRESVEKADFTYNGSSIHVTITAGIEPYDAGRSTDKWIQRADEKLYYGKENGRNRVVI